MAHKTYTKTPTPTTYGLAQNLGIGTYAAAEIQNDMAADIASALEAAAEKILDRICESGIHPEIADVLAYAITWEAAEHWQEDNAAAVA